MRSHGAANPNPFVVIPDADREILLDILQVGDRTVWLNEPNWREQVEEAFIAFLTLVRYTRRGTAMPCPYTA
ncbi:MAG: hypothetical protein HEQ35_03025 [Gloeotrichia echinulata IR180]|nr:hypothetical protein [Gloeotrichia echinulata DEX184]